MSVFEIILSVIHRIIFQTLVKIDMIFPKMYKYKSQIRHLTSQHIRILNKELNIEIYNSFCTFKFSICWQKNSLNLHNSQ